MASSNFLTAEWLKQATDIIIGTSQKKEYRLAKYDDGNDLIIQYINTMNSIKIIHCQRWRGTRLKSWVLGNNPEPDLIIERNVDLEYECWIGRPQSKNILENTYISNPNYGNWLTFPIASKEFLKICKELEKVKYSDFIFCFTLTNCPWGDLVYYYIELKSGIPIKSWITMNPDELAQVEIGIKCSFVDGLSVLYGINIFRNIGNFVEFSGEFMNLGSFTSLFTKPRANKVLAPIENITSLYLSFISRINALDLHTIRQELSTIE